MRKSSQNSFVGGTAYGSQSILRPALDKANSVHESELNTLNTELIDLKVSKIQNIESSKYESIEPAIRNKRQSRYENSKAK